MVRLLFGVLLFGIEYRSTSPFKNCTHTVQSVDLLESEDDELAPVKAFRTLLRIKNTLTPFSDFD